MVALIYDIRPEFDGYCEGELIKNGMDNNGATEEGREQSDDLVESKGLIDSEKGSRKDKNEKSFGSKTGHSTLMKKNKDEKGTKVTLTPSNDGSGATNSSLKLPHKNIPSNERQSNASKGKRDYGFV
ncbi:hypothetical protein V6N13_040771 [Hibiscus sabdariffa]